MPSHDLDTERCSFQYDDGRRCRAGRIPTRTVCILHWQHDGQFEEDAAAIAELTDPANSLHTREGVNRALAVLFRLTAENKLPIRRANALANIGQLILLSLRPDRREVVILHQSQPAPQLLPAPVLELPAGSNGDHSSTLEYGQ